MEIVSVAGDKENNLLIIKYKTSFDKIELSRFLKSIAPKKEKIKFSVKQHNPFHKASGPDYIGTIRVNYQRFSK